MAYENDPEEFTGSDHAVKADPKGKRAAPPVAPKPAVVQPLAEELAAPVEPITKPGSHPKIAIERPRREHAEAVAEVEGPSLKSGMQVSR